MYFFSFGQTTSEGRYKDEVYSTGCLFFADCYIAGLNTQKECDDALEWCVDQGYVLSNGEGLIDRKTITNKISEHFKNRKKRPGQWKLDGGHWYVVDASGVEIYNASGLGWRP